MCLSGAEVHPCARSHDSNALTWLRRSWPWAALQCLGYRDTGASCGTVVLLCLSADERWSATEEQLDAVLGIQEVSAVRKTQEGRSWEGENLIISAQVKLCLSQSHIAVAQDFLTFPIKSSWPKSCFPTFHSINHSVHLSLSYCFEQLQYHLLLSPKPLQTWSPICRRLHVRKYCITFHSRAAILRNLLIPILHCAFWMVSVLQLHPTATGSSPKQTSLPIAQETTRKFLTISIGHSWGSS